jgi:cell division protein FtsB
MKHRRWRNLLPDRGQWAVLLAVLFVIIAAVSFIDVAVRRSASQSAQLAVQNRLAAVQSQNQQLTEALTQAQRGENIEPRARQYFNLARKDEKKYVVQLVPEAVTGSAEPASASAPPYWGAWIERLLQP